MIPIKRTPEPAILTKNKKQWTDDYLQAIIEHNANNSPQTKKKIQKAQNRYHHQSIKKALEQMCFSKCAYCESHITHISYGHIDHFMPKSKFPKHCFDWENLFLGCAVCNGTQYKGDKFPAAEEGGPFINPCLEKPEAFLDFQFDAQTGTANVIAKNTRGQTMVSKLGLNRPELVQHRSNLVRKIAFVALQARNGDLVALAELSRCMEEDQEYAAFARCFYLKFKLHE